MVNSSNKESFAKLRFKHLQSGVVLFLNSLIKNAPLYSPRRIATDRGEAVG